MRRTCWPSPNHSAEDRLAWTQRALALAEGSDDERVAKWPGSLHNNIGWTFHEQGDFERALGHFRHALVWRERQGAIDTIRIACWCIARCLRSLGRVDEALTMQQALLVEYKAEGAQSGYTFEELGECLLLLGREQRGQALVCAGARGACARSLAAGRRTATAGAPAAAGAGRLRLH